MFEASKFLAHKWQGVSKSQIAVAAPVNYIESAQLGEMLRTDGVSSLYSSIVSIADAVRGAENGFYSWTGVKLYYSVFYALRASLAFRGVSVFYLDKSGYWCGITPGSRLNKPPAGVGGSSHKFVMKLFAQEESECKLLSQPIDMIGPLEWMQHVREELNYVNAKFAEPGCPEYFQQIQRHGIRRLLSAYFDDDNLSYAFDRDHAILAYPIEVIKFVSRQRAPAGCFGEGDRASLKAMITDRSGRLPQFDYVTDV